MGFSGSCRALADSALTRSSTRAKACSATGSPRAEFHISPSGGGTRKTRRVVPEGCAGHRCLAPRILRAPWRSFFPGCRFTGLRGATISPTPIQCSPRLVSLRQLAGPDRTLGPPCIPGSVCRRVRPLLDLAVCIPNEQITPNAALTFRSFGALRSLPCQSGAILRAASNCWTDFLQIVCFQRGCAGICWIEATQVTGDTHALGRSRRTHAGAVCACVSPE